MAGGGSGTGPGAAEPFAAPEAAVMPVPPIIITGTPTTEGWMPERCQRT